jgi:hypothetical protein
MKHQPGCRYDNIFLEIKKFLPLMLRSSRLAAGHQVNKLNKMEIWVSVVSS